jgi:molybdopterin synthase sulfur carrier subunit
VIRVLFFARLREQLGQAVLELPHDSSVATVEALQQVLQSRGESWREALSAPNLLCAVNQEQADSTQPVADGDEIAFFPPVTGG